MRTPEQLLEWVRRQWVAHPDDYDSSDAQMLAFIAAVQRDAVEVGPLPVGVEATWDRERFIRSITDAAYEKQVHGDPAALERLADERESLLTELAALRARVTE